MSQIPTFSSTVPIPENTIDPVVGRSVQQAGTVLGKLVIAKQRADNAAEHSDLDADLNEQVNTAKEEALQLKDHRAVSTHYNAAFDKIKEDILGRASNHVVRRRIENTIQFRDSIARTSVERYSNQLGLQSEAVALQKGMAMDAANVGKLGSDLHISIVDVARIIEKSVEERVINDDFEMFEPKAIAEIVGEYKKDAMSAFVDGRKLLIADRQADGDFDLAAALLDEIKGYLKPKDFASRMKKLQTLGANKKAEDIKREMGIALDAPYFLLELDLTAKKILAKFGPEIVELLDHDGAQFSGAFGLTVAANPDSLMVELMETTLLNAAALGSDGAMKVTLISKLIAGRGEESRKLLLKARDVQIKAFKNEDKEIDHVANVHKDFDEMLKTNKVPTKAIGGSLDTLNKFVKERIEIIGRNAAVIASLAKFLMAGKVSISNIPELKNHFIGGLTSAGDWSGTIFSLVSMFAQNPDKTTRFMDSIGGGAYSLFVVETASQHINNPQLFNKVVTLLGKEQSRRAVAILEKRVLGDEKNDPISLVSLADQAARGGWFIFGGYTSNKHTFGGIEQDTFYRFLKMATVRKAKTMGVDFQGLSKGDLLQLSKEAMQDMMTHQDGVQTYGGYSVIPGSMIPAGGNSDALKAALKTAGTQGGTSARTFEGITLDAKEQIHLIPVGTIDGELVGFVLWDKDKGLASVLRKDTVAFHQQQEVFFAIKGVDSLRKYPRRFKRLGIDIHKTGIVSLDEPNLQDEFDYFAMLKAERKLGRRIFTDPESPGYNAKDVLVHKIELIKIGIENGWTRFSPIGLGLEDTLTQFTADLKNFKGDGSTDLQSDATISAIQLMNRVMNDPGAMNE